MTLFLTRKVDCLVSWLLPEDSDGWLTCLRVGVGIQLVCSCFALRHAWNYLLGGRGEALISRHATEAMVSTESVLIPRLGWLVDAGKLFGLSESSTVCATWILLMVAGLLLLFGLWCRVA